MKAFRISLLSTAVLMLAASCLDDKESYSAGFYFRKPTSAITMVYANNVGDSISFFSYGNWTLTRDSRSDGNWCQVSATTGVGGQVVSFPITFQPNTSGEGRSAVFTVSDTDHPGEASTSLLYWQYGTRGDGSLGLAADVKAIACSDGTRMELTYDEQHRPLSLQITRDGALLRSLALSYDDRDSVLTVTDGNKTLRSTAYSRDYQPQQLIGGGDTVAYYAQYYSTGVPIPANTAFNLEHRSVGGERTIYAFLIGGQSLLPDSLHRADSLRIGRVSGGQATVERLKLQYSAADNRHQSLDVNQLIFGTDLCDPYQLLSLFRYSRSTSIVSEASDNGNGYVVETEQNADQSVSRLTVKRRSEGTILPDEPLVYTFEY